jgi:uncharacterized GH25 family protein
VPQLASLAAASAVLEARRLRWLRALLALIVLFEVAGPAAAHDFWIVPSSFRSAPGAAVAVRLKVGEHLKGDALPRDPVQVERFAVVGPGGEIQVKGLAGAEPAGFARVGGDGLYWILYDGAHNRLDLAAEAFEKALREEGLERISALRQERGESGRPSREVFSRCAKALVRVGDGGTGFDRRLGLELELIPERDPMAVGPGGELPVRLVFRGRPLAGARVAALHARHAEGTIAARTDGEGRVRLRLPEAGFWLIKAVHMVPAAAGSGIDWESLWASLTFELAGP